MAHPLLALRDALFNTGFAEVVTYQPVAGAPVTLNAVRSGDYAGSLSALGNPLRGVSFEIPKSQLAAIPAKGSTITGSDGIAWTVQQATDIEHAAAWLAVVEAAAS